MDFLLPLLKEKPDPCLSAAFSAVALAALATRPNSRALVSKVDLSYAKALNTINASLKDSRTASSASTLVAVLLMTYFEVPIHSFRTVQRLIALSAIDY